MCSVCVFSFAFVFFKQKTAYEMRISDWSSDVCSSDLPAEPRDGARLLHVGASGSATGLADRSIADLPDLLRPGDLLVTNDTKVIPARLAGRRGTAGVEVTQIGRAHV